MTTHGDSHPYLYPLPEKPSRRRVRTFPRHRPPGRALVGDPEGVPGQGAGRLDTTTPSDDITRGFFASIFRARARRIWSRARLGLYLPGHYLFVTLTSSPDSPDIIPSARRLRRWLQAHLQDFEYFQVITDEGYGVCHLLVRQEKSSWFPIRELRAYWRQTHQAFVIDVRPVRDTDGIAVYLSEQSVRGLAREVTYQPMVLSWSRSRYWIPPKFIPEFRRYWSQSKELSPDQKETHLREWIRTAYQESP